MSRTVLLVLLLAAVLGLAVAAVTIPPDPQPSRAAPLADPSDTRLDRPIRSERVEAARAALHEAQRRRASEAAAAVEEARIDAQAAWDRGDVPLTPPTIAFALFLVAAMVRWSLRRDLPLPPEDRIIDLRDD